MEHNDELCSSRGYCVEGVSVSGTPEALCECGVSYQFNGDLGKDDCFPKFFCSPDCVNGTCEPIESVDNEGNVISEDKVFCSCDPGRH